MVPRFCLKDQSEPNRSKQAGVDRVLVPRENQPGSMLELSRTSTEKQSIRNALGVSSNEHALLIMHLGMHNAMVRYLTTSACRDQIGHQ